MNETARAAAADSASQRHAPWWVWTLVAAGAVGVALFLVMVGVVVIPPALANLRTEVASAQTPMVVGSEGESVTVAVPDGWLITRQDDAHAVITSPDRGMTVAVELSADEPAAAASAAGVASPLVETLASGLTVAHGAPVAAADQDPATIPVLIAAVGPVAGGSIVFSVSSDDLDRYRPALASLLEGVKP
ncbi:hypothetical protein [Microbacterium schleiferi]|uniref:hypothetical protein n=1 Tax=Microbacterium schleiferi TaxID=69362 RepID=UPI0031204A09